MSEVFNRAIDQSLWPSARDPSQFRSRGRVGTGSVLADRFEVTGLLGSGGMGYVVGAFDRERETHVAVKLLTNGFGARSLADLKREFRAASELVHPNLVRLHELFAQGHDCFFTMELVHGSILPNWRSRNPGHDALRPVFRQLAHGLLALHHAGTLHTDLKPSNFLIADDRVVLLDFGLARPIGLSTNAESTATPAYMAPEQAMVRPLTEAADWYSLGVVLYEALTGVLPRWRPSLAKLASAPADLRELCLDLLELEPKRRPTGEEVLERIGAPSVAPPSVPLLAINQALVGRENELTAMQAAFDSAVEGQAGVILVRGPSGIGKTALAREAVHRFAARGALVFAGTCRERESVGYKAVDAILEDVVTVLDELTPIERARFLPADFADLTVLFPALRAARMFEGQTLAAADAEDDGLTRLRALRTFEEFFARLSRHHPLVLWIDDLQWSDTESALLLGPLLVDDQARAVLFIGGYRSGIDAIPLLDALRLDRRDRPTRTLELVLPALSSADSERLARDLLPPEYASLSGVANHIARDAAGHPLFIAELAFAVGLSQDTRGTSLAGLIARRVSALPEIARDLLEINAVAGAPLSREFLRKAQKLSSAELDNATDTLKALRLMRTHGLRDNDSMEIHHDRVREIILAALDIGSQQRWHRALANELLAAPNHKPEQVALHLQAIGETRRAGHYWLRAAAEARQALAFDHAAELYRKGLESAELDPGARRDAETQRAEAFAQAGQGRAAANLYLRVAAGSKTFEAIELRRRAAEQLLLSGHVDDGLMVIDEVLHSIGMRVSKSPRGAFWSAVLGRAMLLLRGFGHQVRRATELASPELARLDASWTVACSLGVVDPVRGAAFQSKHLLLAVRAGEPRRLLRAMTLEASYLAMSGRGNGPRISALLKVANELALESGDDASVGLLHLARGVVSYLGGELTTALCDLDRAIEVLSKRCAGAVWELITAQRFLIASLFFLGHLRRLGAIVPQLLEDSERTGNRYASMCFASAYSWSAWLTKDQPAEARRQLARVARDWPLSSGFGLSQANVLIGECHVDLYEGDPAGAHGRLAERWPDLVRSGLFRVGLLRVQFWYLRATSALSLALGASSALILDRTRLLRDARHAIGQLRRERIGRAAPLAEVLVAGVAIARGDLAAASDGFERGACGFDRQGMRLFAAAARERARALLPSTQRAKETAPDAFAREGVLRRERMIDMLAPDIAGAVAAQHAHVT